MIAPLFNVGIEDVLFEYFAGPGFVSIGQSSEQADGENLQGGQFRPEGFVQAAPVVGVHFFWVLNLLDTTFAEKEGVIWRGFFGKGFDFEDIQFCSASVAAFAA